MRINLFAGPGSGKSTTAAWLFSQLKIAGYSIELCSEYVKSWSYQKRDVKPFDQIYLLGKQMQYEYRFISAGIKNVITDSPVLLSCSYTQLYNKDLGLHDHMVEIVKVYEKSHPSLNIFLNRDNKPYIEEGRYQTEKQARELDLIIRDDLYSAGVKYSEFSFYDKESILEFVRNKIDKV